MGKRTERSPSENRIDARTAQTVVLAVVVVMIGFALVRGLSIILEGPERWREGSHATALLLPGAPPSWGIILMGLGIAAAFCLRTGKYRGLFCILYIMSGWCVVFAGGFVISAIRDPGSALGGIWTYVLCSILYLVLGAAIRESTRQE